MVPSNSEMRLLLKGSCIIYLARARHLKYCEIVNSNMKGIEFILMKHRHINLAVRGVNDYSKYAGSVAELFIA